MRNSKVSRTHIFSVVAALVCGCIQSTCLAASADGYARLYGSQFDPILVDVVVGDASLRFLLDTTASNSFLDVRHHGLLGIPRPALNANKRSLHPGRFSLALGETHVPLEVIGLCDLDALAKFGAIKTPDGVLGLDVIEQIRLELDFDNSRWRVLDQHFTPPRDATRIQTHLVAGEPSVVATLDGKRHSFAIATGVIATAQVHPIRRDAEHWRVTGANYVMSLVNGEISLAANVRGPVLGLGPYTHSNLVFQANARTPSSRLGASYWRRYARVILDFPSQQIYLAPGAAFNDPTYEDACGLLLKTKDDAVIIAGTAVHSVSRQSSVPTGAKLVRIDQHKVLNIDSAYRQLRTTGRSVLEIEYELHNKRHVVRLQRIESEMK